MNLDLEHSDSHFGPTSKFVRWDSNRNLNHHVIRLGKQMNPEQQLRASIAKAFGGPGRIRVASELHRSAITALAVHCFFVQSGFIVQEPGDKTQSDTGFLSFLRGREQKKIKKFRPHESWLSLLPSPEFMFRYTYPGKCGCFTCHCSLKVGTEQMLVHVSEENSDNIQFVGLLVNYSVPEGSKGRLQQMDSWDGILGDLDLLIFNLDTYLMEPLLRKAMNEDDVSTENKIVWNLNGGGKWIRLGALFLILSFLTTKLMHNKSHQS